MRKLLLGTLFLLSLSMNAQENDTKEKTLSKPMLLLFAFKIFN